MQLLTNSRLKAYRLCPSYHQFAYVDGWRPRIESPALGFGTAFHKGMEHYWRDESLPPRLMLDDYDNAKVMALLHGYGARWMMEDRERYKTLAVELEFDLPLVHPVTGEQHEFWRLAGKIDLLIAEGDSIVLGEHKSSSEDIGVGSTYWQRLDLDTQILIYLHAVREMGYDAQKILYDVAAKPRQRPKKNERSDAFQARIMSDIADNPSDYYARGELVRTQKQIDQALIDAWDFAEHIYRDMNEGWRPRNPDGCFKYGRPCSYFQICAGLKTFEEMDLVKSDKVNPELSKEAA